MWAIDHGAALYFHHSWPNRGSDPARFAGQAFDASMHVLLDVADDLAPIHHDLAGKVDSALLDSVLAEVPDEWLEPTQDLPGPSLRTLPETSHPHPADPTAMPLLTPPPPGDLASSTLGRKPRATFGWLAAPRSTVVQPGRSTEA